MEWDFFISHATEDKADVAKPLADMLSARGFKVWYDEYTLAMGDNLRRSIEYGLANSRFGVVILSKSFFAKKWTQLELDGLFALEHPGEKRILPVWHNVSASDVERFSSFLAMRLGVATSQGVDYIIKKIVEAVDKGTNAASSAVNEATQTRLHPHSIEILQAAQSGDGTIATYRLRSGFTIVAGGKTLGGDGGSRAEALDLHCVDELTANGLIEYRSESLSVVTQDGYDYVVPTGVVEAPKPRFPTVTPSNLLYAKDFLQAAVAGDGHLVLIRFLAGQMLSAGRWSIKSGRDRRVEARWESVLSELVRVGLLIAKSEEMYFVSHLGFLWADSLSSQNVNTAQTGEV